MDDKEVARKVMALPVNKRVPKILFILFVLPSAFI